MKVKRILILGMLAWAGWIQAAERPNVLVIMADDLGYHDLGFQGSDHIKTPNLDKIAAAGMRFTDAHVAASVCSPSRAGFITGRYQQRFGHEANCPTRGKGMDVNERTIGQAFKDLGYRTAIFGKWHLGNLPEMYPTHRGFDVFYGLREGSRSYWYNAKKTDKPGNPHAAEYNGKPAKFDGHFTDWLGEKAVEFIEETDKPFLAFLSFTAPHSPLQSKPEDMKALGLPRDNYAGLIYGLDRNVGYVLDALKRTGKLDNTIIWFLSDNGGVAGRYSNAPLGGKKGMEFEGGHRVPFLLYWKGHVPAGKDYTELVSSMDIFPTSVKAAGGSLKQERPLDGVDLMPFITGKKSGVPHQQLYWRKLECADMRDGDWKIIRVEGLPVVLYNLKDDIAEQHNLAGKYPERVARMEKMLKNWETQLIKPLWLEGKIWTKVRYDYHKAWFETGKPPVKKKRK
jgi:arylsulfatase A-like enzyme